MINKKQSSIDWLFEKMMYVTWLRNRDEISAGKADEIRAKFLEQAKAMHKEEMIDFAFSWSHERADRIDIEKDYNETFES